MKTFEIGKTYYTHCRIKREYFTVAARTAKTITFAYIGTQNESGNFHPQAIDVARNGELQKSRVYINGFGDAEYAYVKVEDDSPWIGKHEVRLEISAEKEAHLPA